MSRFRRLYGAGPLHLVSMMACLCFAGYLVWTILPAPQSIRILIWVGGAAVAHDLVLWPVYTVIDRAARAGARRRVPPVPWINHVRVPVVLSAVTLVISWPLVTRHSEAAYHAASGLSEHPYLGRWLLLSGLAFAVSLLIYAVRILRWLRRS
jgi:hypothetical protein